MVEHVSSERLEELIATSNLPIVCDFWASWCGPCRMLGPVFEEVSKKYDGRALFVKVNVRGIGIFYLHTVFLRGGYEWLNLIKLCRRCPVSVSYKESRSVKADFGGDLHNLVNRKLIKLFGKKISFHSLFPFSFSIYFAGENP